MPTTDIDKTVKEIQGTLLTDMPGLGGWSRCPCCDTSLIPDESELTFDEIEKLRHWTFAQLVSFRQIQKNSGLTFRQLLAETSEQPRPGIGAIANPTVLGVNLHGMFIGIETDGYAHS